MSSRPLGIGFLVVGSARDMWGRRGMIADTRVIRTRQVRAGRGTRIAGWAALARPIAVSSWHGYPLTAPSVRPRTM